jgi:hypothetical protein
MDGLDEQVFAEAMTMAQRFAASFEEVLRDVRLTALAILVAGTFKSPRNGLMEFRGLLDALIAQMNKPTVN